MAQFKRDDSYYSQGVGIREANPAASDLVPLGYNMKKGDIRHVSVIFQAKRLFFKLYHNFAWRTGKALE